MKVVVYHRSYGCDTGCCGHVVRTIDGEQETERGFEFDHPYHEAPIEFAKRLVTQELGGEHVADLDWDQCIISED